MSTFEKSTVDAAGDVEDERKAIRAFLSSPEAVEPTRGKAAKRLALLSGRRGPVKSVVGLVPEVRPTQVVEAEVLLAYLEGH